MHSHRDGDRKIFVDGIYFFNKNATRGSWLATRSDRTLLGAPGLTVSNKNAARSNYFMLDIYFLFRSSLRPTPVKKGVWIMLHSTVEFHHFSFNKPLTHHRAIEPRCTKQQNGWDPTGVVPCLLATCSDPTDRWHSPTLRPLHVPRAAAGANPWMQWAGRPRKGQAKQSSFGCTSGHKCKSAGPLRSSIQCSWKFNLVLWQHTVSLLKDNGSLVVIQKTWERSVSALRSLWLMALGV